MPSGRKLARGWGLGSVHVCFFCFEYVCHAAGCKHVHTGAGRRRVKIMICSVDFPTDFVAAADESACPPACKFAYYKAFPRRAPIRSTRQNVSGVRITFPSAEAGGDNNLDPNLNVTEATSRAPRSTIEVSHFRYFFSEWWRSVTQNRRNVNLASKNGVLVFLVNVIIHRDSV